MRRDEGEFEVLVPARSAAADPPSPGGSRGGRIAGSPVEDGRVELRPRRTSEVLDLALEILRSRFGVLVGLAALLWLPIRLAQPFIGLHRWMTSDAADTPLGAVFSLFFNLLGTWVVWTLATALVSLLVAAKIEGRDLPVRAALARLLSRTFPVLGIALFVSILTGSACLCACFPGLFLAARFYVAPVVCVVEGAGVGSSLSRSFDLGRGRVLHWIGLTVVVLILTLPLRLLENVVDDVDFRERCLAVLGTAPSVFDGFTVVLTSLLTGVASALQGVIATVWYYDCRARSEGIDLAARLARAAAREPGAPEPAA